MTGGAWFFAPEFGQNLFSEALGLVATVALIDKLIGWAKDEETKPARMAAFRDAVVVAYEANELILHLARSSVPASEFTRVRGTMALVGEEWLGAYFTNLRSNSGAPFGAPPPLGQGAQTWGNMLPTMVTSIQKAIARYLERHSAHGDPRLTDVIQDLEENGVFRSLSYGSGLFWTGQIPGLYEDFIRKVSRLVDTLDKVREDYGMDHDARRRFVFNWNLLEIELRESPTSSPQAWWRPLARP